MAAAGSGARAGSGAGRATLELLRFDLVQRVAHWANATLFGILVLTAIPLSFGGVERLVGRHVLLADLHLWTGVALPVPVLVALAGPWGVRFRRDVRRFNRWTDEELRWLWSLGRRGRAVDKFNPGQKLNAVFVGGAVVVLLGTGIVMRWFGLFPVDWRTGATFVHQVLAWVVTGVIVGHVVMAVTHPVALRSMLLGRVPISWARRHAPAWLAEEQAGSGPATTGRTGWPPRRSGRPPRRSPTAASPPPRPARPAR
jgi:formate dehydrogenase subunit gamma